MRKGYKGQLRIVGGRLRGRKITVAPVPGLRPTTDRIRETVFNWLQPGLEGARCLDLFAGSGALGFEAVSRGAAEVYLVESDRRAAAHLVKTAELFAEPAARVVDADARSFLGRDPMPFDIVFLDPPFHSPLLQVSCEMLELRGWLAPRAAVYLESDSPLQGLVLPVAWRLHRAQRAGDVHYGLALRDAAPAP